MANTTRPELAPTDEDNPERLSAVGFGSLIVVGPGAEPRIRIPDYVRMFVEDKTGSLIVWDSTRPDRWASLSRALADIARETYPDGDVRWSTVDEFAARAH